MNQKITETYRRHMESYANRFPAAHRFLMALENGSAHGLWLSTATNAHLYKHDAFLAYIQFGNVTHSEPTLVLSPNFHIRVVETTSDQSRLLFPMPILQILRKHSSATPAWWAERRGGAIELGNGTRDVVFDDLLGFLRSMKVSERDAAPAELREKVALGLTAARDGDLSDGDEFFAELAKQH